MDKNIWPRHFGPSFLPKEMLAQGVFEGRYIGAIQGAPAIPKDWFGLPKVLSGKDRKQYPPDPSLNAFGLQSRQPLSVWQENGWLTKASPHGWFEWYIKFTLGRRLEEEDHWQINRWRSFVARHMGQVKAHCQLADRSCHSKQRQGLLQWGWDSLQHEFSDRQVLANAKRMARQLGCALEPVATESLPSLAW